MTRRQDLPIVYSLNGAVTIIKTDVLKLYKTLSPEKLTAYIMDEKASLDIDTEWDLKIEQLLREERRL